jgi:uncharacterized protein YoxC
MPSEGVDVFHANITASDDGASKTLEHIGRSFHKVADEAENVGHATERMHKPHIWAELNEHINLTREHFGELHAGIGEVGESITELLPALGALTAFGSVASLFETVEHVSESYAQLAHAATELGIGARDLQKLDAVATLTDTSVEGLHKSMSRLNRVISDAAAGHNKDAAEGFKRLHISLSDGHGHLRTSLDLLPQLADAFAHTGSAADRTSNAFKLFGKQGVDMLPLLMKGGEAARKSMEEAGEYTYDMTPAGENLEHMNESFKKLGLATHAFTDELGSKLAPVLAPIVDHVNKWVLANKGWIATGITNEVQKFATWLEKVDWPAIGKGLEGWAEKTERFIDDLGGASRVADALGVIIAYKGVKFAYEQVKEVAEFTKAVIGLGDKIVGLAAKWDAVGVSASAAGERMTAAEAGAAVAGGAGSAGGAGVGVAAGAGGAGLGSAGLDRIRANALADAEPWYRRGPHVDPVTSMTIRRRAFTASANFAYNAYEAYNAPPQAIDKNDVRAKPGLATLMTRAQFDALPDSLGTYEPDFLERTFSAPTNYLNRLHDDIFGPAPPASSRDASLPFRVEGSVDTTLTIVGLPAGASVVADSTSSGIATMPTIRGDVGQAFYDRLAHR